MNSFNKTDASFFPMQAMLSYNVPYLRFIHHERIQYRVHEFTELFKKADAPTKCPYKM